MELLFKRKKMGSLIFCLSVRCLSKCFFLQKNFFIQKLLLTAISYIGLHSYKNSRSSLFYYYKMEDV